MNNNVADTALRKQISFFFEKLEQYYPEHKVFALDSIDKTLRERLSDLYKAVGAASAEEFLQGYGYEMISGDEVKQIRGHVKYVPGKEPPIVKGKIDSMLARLAEYYPNRKIEGSLQNTHKNLAKTISGLYQWLGYENSQAMLSAYGFQSELKQSGRPARDYEPTINALKAKYQDNKAKTIKQICDDNPECASLLKTLQNRANETFGMSIKDYFRQIGVLEAPAAKPAQIREKMVKYVLVKEESRADLIPCIVEYLLKEDDVVEFCSSESNDVRTGLVKATCFDKTEKDLPYPLDKMGRILRKVPKKEFREREEAKQQYIFCKVSVPDLHITQYYLSPFEEINVGDCVRVPVRSYMGVFRGVVETREVVTKKTAPVSPDKAKKIAKITKSVKGEEAARKAVVERYVLANQTAPLSPPGSSAEIASLLQRMTYYSGAVFRGFITDVFDACKLLFPDAANPISNCEKLNDAVFQFQCDSAMVPIVLERFPNLKALFFAEDWKKGDVYLGYSESGSPTATSLRLIGKCDFYERDRWSFIHDPAEASFHAGTVNYVFQEKPLWERIDYVLSDGATRLVTQEIAPSIPYKRNAVSAPWGRIEIRFPG